MVSCLHHYRSSHVIDHTNKQFGVNKKGKIWWWWWWKVKVKDMYSSILMVNSIQI